MDPLKAAALNNAIARTDHPRHDYRTAEAKRYTQWLADFARPLIPPGARLIDLGCAAGKQTFAAEDLGARALGLDCAFEPLRLASGIAAEMGSRSGFIQANFLAIPFAAASFDIVLFPKNLVETAYDEAALLAEEIHRILKPGGRLILTLRDGLLHQAAKPAPLAAYHPQTGQFANQTEIPGQGAFDYPSYFWTCAFAAHVFGRCLSLEQVLEMGEDYFMLVFHHA